MTNLISLSLYSFNSFVFKTFITVCFFSVFFFYRMQACKCNKSFVSFCILLFSVIFIVFFSLLFCFLLLPNALSISPLISLFVPPFTFRSFFFYSCWSNYFCVKSSTNTNHKSKKTQQTLSLISIVPRLYLIFPFIFFVCLHILVLRHQFSDCISFTF